MRRLWFAAAHHDPLPSFKSNHVFKKPQTNLTNPDGFSISGMKPERVYWDS